MRATLLTGTLRSYSVAGIATCTLVVASQSLLSLLVATTRSVLARARAVPQLKSHLEVDNV